MPPPPTIRLHFEFADGQRRSIESACGQSLMRAAVSAGIDAIVADCGGLMSCATCHVFVDPDWWPRLPPPEPDEQSMLDMTAAEREHTSRLSCQIALTPELDGLSLRLPDRQY